MKKILLLLLSLILVTGCGCEKKEKPTDKNNEQQNIVTDISVSKLDMVDFITFYEEGISEIYYTVENNTEEVISYNSVICEMYNEENNLIYSLRSDLGTLNPNESKDIKESVAMDLSKVYNVKYSVE